MKNRLGILSALLVLGLPSVFAQDDDKRHPKITKTAFDGPMVNIKYFDDSNVITATDYTNRVVHRSTDAGATWDVVEDIAEGEAFEVMYHPFNNKVAVCIGTKRKHWITKDQGEKWASFETEGDPVSERMLRVPPISFHAADADKIILNTLVCHDFSSCQTAAYYTKDGFDSEPKLLRTDTQQCMWARTHDLFETGDEEKDRDQTMCIVRGKYSSDDTDFRLLTSTDYFEKNEVEPEMEDERSVAGIASLAAVKGYIVAAARAARTQEMSLYVTNDAQNWYRARFGDLAVEKDAYTILESTNYSIQVDVMTTTNDLPMGTLFTSNSNGTYFTMNIEHTNRNRRGYVDFEKVQNIQGIVMVNTVHNWEKIEQGLRDDKKIETKISFDDGRTFEEMKVGKERLHLHAITDQRNSGRVFSSPAPGLVMGNGNTGKFLGKRAHASLFVSDDAGLTWRKALDDSHMYEFGDQGSLLVAVAEKPDTKYIQYSLNHGKDWTKQDFGDYMITPRQLTTVPDSTSRKFILYGEEGSGSEAKYVIVQLDFDELHERSCDKKDFEDWHARLDENDDPICVMGHTQSYRRRKADADCFVGHDFKDPEPEFEVCKCMDQDFECDSGFQRSDNGKECIAVEPLTPSKDECKDGEKNFIGSSGWRKIPGNACKGGVNKEESIERDCKDTVKSPASNKIAHTVTSFQASSFREFHYLERDRHDDETVLMRTDERQAFISRDHGKNWERIDVGGDEVLAIYPHEYFHETVYFITPDRKVWYSHDRGVKLHSFTAPEMPNLDHVQYLRFHPSEKDWLIWTGGKDCSGGFGFGEDCRSVAHISTNGGREWKTLLDSVRKCVFAKSEKRKDSDELVYCEQYQGENPESPLELLSSDDFFVHKRTLFEDIVNFATMSEYIIVATRDEENDNLRVDASVNGKDFANAQFPLNFQVPHKQAYTVLDSSTHAVFLHVTVNNVKDQEYGSILKSNSNGTSYVKSVSDVNRDTEGYVDFEKMRGLEGVALVNTVANREQADKRAKKLLVTLITHNDGAEWSPLNAPEKDSEGKPYDCTEGDLCSLHLHGYTERKDVRHTYSSPSAAGLMMGIGNVGSSLGRRAEGDTFITRDGGVTWAEAMKGKFMWEYGDSGSIIVIVAEEAPTDFVYYTLDEGMTWEKYRFSEKGEMIIDNISTLPSDTSRNFLLWGRSGDSRGDIVTINLDFSGLTNEQCKLNPEAPEADDFWLWKPRHPIQDTECLFGHVAEYYRKRTDRKCYIGRLDIKLHDIAENCTCTRRDFEW